MDGSPRILTICRGVHDWSLRLTFRDEEVSFGPYGSAADPRRIEARLRSLSAARGWPEAVETVRTEEAPGACG